VFTERNEEILSRTRPCRLCRVAIPGLHARTTTPPVYVVVEIDEITDANGFEALRQAADATAIKVQFENGRYLASTENVTALDGSASEVLLFHCFR
jgi:hypothetical protein